MENKRIFAMTGLFAASVLASGASAQLNPIGPFTGDESETFDVGAQVIFTPCMPDRVFNNTADMCTPGNSGCHTTRSWGFRCTIFPHAGIRLFGSAGGFVEYTFDNPVGAFGGYFGSNAFQDFEDHLVDLNFYDADDDLIGSEQIEVGHCTWDWFGWESATPIARVEVINTVFGGAFVNMDSMEIRAAGPSDCLTMTVSALVAGQSATWDVSGATPNTEVAIVYGFSPGNTNINGFAGYCADFGINGVNTSRVICRSSANGAGDVSCKRAIPNNARGVRVLSQAAERNTCPDSCMSNLDDQVVG